MILSKASAYTFYFAFHLQQELLNIESLDIVAVTRIVMMVLTTHGTALRKQYFYVKSIRAGLGLANDGMDPPDRAIYVTSCLRQCFESLPGLHV